MKTIGAVPFGYQRVLIRAIQPAIVSGITYVVINFLAGNPVAIFITIIVVLSLASLIYMRSHRRHLKELRVLHAVKPVRQYFEEDDVPKEKAVGVIDNRKTPALSKFAQKRMKEKILVNVSEDDTEITSSSDDDDDDDDAGSISSSDDGNKFYRRRLQLT